jgi:hypothetical protein
MHSAGKYRYYFKIDSVEEYIQLTWDSKLI